MPQRHAPFASLRVTHLEKTLLAEKSMALVEIRDVHKVFQRDSRAHRDLHRSHARHRRRLVHRADGTLGLRQVHPAQPARRARQADQWHHPRRRTRGERDDAGPARSVAGAAHRIRLPEPEPPAGAHGIPERGAAAAAHEALEEGARRARPARARRGRAGGPAATLPAPALGRPGAAGRDRPGHRGRPDPGPARRADRPARRQELAGRAGPARSA